MSLAEKFNEIALEDLKNMDLLFLDNYSRQNNKLLFALYKEEVISDSSIEAALEEAVFKHARKSFEFMARSNRSYPSYADHVGRPECLAYALKKEKFSPEEIAKIPFDHGQNAFSFVQEYDQENLLSSLRNELLNPEPLPESEGSFDPHP